MEMDMTTGKPVKALLKFSVPLFAGNIMQNLYIVFDTAVVGHILGKNALAAVGNSYVPTLIINSIILGLSSGILILLAQVYGSKETEKAQNCMGSIQTLLFLIGGQRDFHGNGYPGRGYRLCSRLFENHCIGNPIPVSIQFLFCGDKSRRGFKDTYMESVRILPYEYGA